MNESLVLAKFVLGNINDSKKTAEPCPGQHLQSQCTGYVTGMIRYIAGNQEVERGSENKATTYESSAAKNLESGAYTVAA